MLSTLTPLICTLVALTGADCGSSETGVPATAPEVTTEPVVIPAVEDAVPMAVVPEVVEAAAPTATPAPVAAGDKVDWTDALGTAAITGSIKFKGEAPARAKLDTSSDGKCHASEVLDETVIVGADGGLKNVFVWVSDGLKGYKFKTPTEPAVLTQKGCVYIPHVMGLMEKQQLQIHNEDDTTHNVHSFSKKNKGFNQAQPAGAPTLEKVFKRDEGLFQIKCDMHAWMGCWVAVVETPFYAVSDDAGNYDLGKLPAGTYEVSFRHESLGTQKQTITVADGAAQAIDLSFE